MDGQQTPGAVVALRAAVDALIGIELAGLPTVQVTGLLVEVETQKRRLEALDQAVLAEVRDRAIDGDYARTGPADLLITLLRVSPAEAKARIGRSLDLGPRRALTGQPLPPLFEGVAAAVRDGQISGRHADAITSCLDRVSIVAPAEVAPWPKSCWSRRPGMSTPASWPKPRSCCWPPRPGRPRTPRRTTAPPAWVQPRQTPRRWIGAARRTQPRVDRTVRDRLRLPRRPGPSRRRNGR